MKKLFLRGKSKAFFIVIIAALIVFGAGYLKDMLPEGFLGLFGSTGVETESDGAYTGAEKATEEEARLSESGSYYSKEEVAEYIFIYGRLPENFITKKEAAALGWNGGGVDEYAAGKAIGGDIFGNYEGLLPSLPGRTWYECDIDTKGKNSRGAKRIVFSSDGLVYYTDDHYESFTELSRK